jgi:DNA polymerase III sliding clamp (beta) subunit (PCNA family)
MKWTVNGNALEIHAKVPEQGMFTRKLAATNTGEGLEVGFSAKVVLAPAKAFKGSDVRVEFNGSRNPALILCDAQPHIKFVVLPLITY